MPLDRVPGEQFDVLVDHADGQAGHPCSRVPTPLRLLLPGQVIRYTHSFFLGDRFKLPGGTKVSLRHLVGFKLQLASRVARPPLEDAVVRRRPVERAGTRAPGLTAGVPVAAARTPRDF